MLSKESLHEFRSAWLPNITDEGLRHLISLLEKAGLGTSEDSRPRRPERPTRPAKVEAPKKPADQMDDDDRALEWMADE